MPIRNTSTPQARIVIGMFLAHVSGVPLDVVRPVLEAIAPMPRYGGANGYEIAFRRECGYAVEPDDGIFIMAGLVPRVVAQLDCLGYGVVIECRAQWETLLNANHAMRESGNETTEDQQFLDAVADTPRGLIVVHFEDEAVWLIAKLRSFFPTARMLIVAANTERADRVCGSLSKLCELPVKRTFEGVRSMPVRTYVCTQAEFALHAAQDWTVIVFSDVESVLAAKSQETLGKMFDYAQDNMQVLLTYCFLRGNQAIGPRDQLQLEQLCGGEIFRQPETRTPLPGVTAIIASMIHCPTLPRRTDLDAKRALWHNASRNEAVSNLAKVIAGGNKSLINRIGLLRYLSTDVEDRSVAILVESTAHGNKLLESLPGWELRCEVPALGDPADGRSHVPVGNHCIGTYVYAERNGVAADVLVRADGAKQWPVSSRVFSCRAYRDDSRVVVIDIVDANGSIGDVHTQRRSEGYERRGWRVVGPVDVVLGKATKRRGPKGQRKVSPSKRKT